MKFALLVAAVAADCSVAYVEPSSNAEAKKTCIKHADDAKALETGTWKALATVGTKTGTCTKKVKTKAVAGGAAAVDNYFIFSECTAGKTFTMLTYSDSACKTATTADDLTAKAEGCDATTGWKYTITNPAGAMLLKGTASSLSPLSPPCNEH